ncbi:MAG: glycosyltransferase family 4 protein [Pseudomonadota bacterium]
MTVKILGVIDEEPFDPYTWSGSGYYFFNALKEYGCLRDAISAQPSRKVQLFYKALSFQLGMERWKFRYHLNTGLFGQMSKVAVKKISKIDQRDFNVLLQVGAWYDLAELKNKVFASYHDGNLSTLLASPYGYPAIKKKYIQQTFDYEKQLYGKMNYIFPMSEWLAGSFINDFGVETDKVFPVGAGINLPYIKHVEERDPESAKILFVGKDFSRKGGPVLIEAFRSVRKKVKNAELIIVGPELGNLPEGVRCEGFISKQTSEGVNKLLALYSEASIFVLPSLYEPFGIVLAEAMAHFLPCIGTNNCAMPEIIDDGRTGYLVEPNDSRSLADALIVLLEDHALREEMGRHAYEKYFTQYRWEVVVDKIVGVLEDHGR